MKFSFQFTPLREGRQLTSEICKLCLYFNSRPSARGDLTRSRKMKIPSQISIHAPPRGATQYLGPRNLEELFQFTPLREGRRVVRSDVLDRSNFNSRPSARGDDVSPDSEGKLYIFQFTPLREGRPASISRTTHSATFQFTPLREGRQHAPPVHHAPRHFNSRPSARGDQILTQPQSINVVNFNSRPSARGDLYYPPFGVMQLISIHAPPRGAPRGFYKNL